MGKLKRVIYKKPQRLGTYTPFVIDTMMKQMKDILRRWSVSEN
jgi:hypothetical protein